MRVGQCGTNFPLSIPQIEGGFGNSPSSSESSWNVQIKLVGLEILSPRCMRRPKRKYLASAREIETQEHQ
jgi:hypothetical protein